MLALEEQRLANLGKPAVKRDFGKEGAVGRREQTEAARALRRLGVHEAEREMTGNRLGQDIAVALDRIIALAVVLVRQFDDRRPVLRGQEAERLVVAERLAVLVDGAR